MTLLQSGIAKPSSGYDIDQSLRLDNAGANNSANHVVRLQNFGSESDPNGWATDGNQKTWTISFWMKWDNEDSYNERFIYWVNGARATSDVMGYDVINLVGGQLQYYCYVSAFGSQRALTKTNRVFRDPSAWYHCVLAMDSTLASNNDRLKLYVNGVRETSFATDSQIGQDQTTNTNMNADTYVGASISVTSTESFGGYLAEFHRIDGQALGPEYFGETDSATNQWVPIEVTGITYGTNGFYLPFSSTELANSFTDSSAGLDTFTSTGTTSWTAPAGVTSVEYLVVGGGGGGGGVVGGGGGAGDFKTGTLSVTPGSSYTVTVGAGGSGGVGNGNGSDGSSSVFSTITSTGGGGGAYNANNGRDGASGGGGAHNNGGTGGTGGSGTGTNGNDGGDGNGGTFPNGASGGGGGSGGAGGSPGGTTGGSGGAGTSSSISGSALFYAAGGGGWGNSAGSGGSSIGGNSAGGSGTTNGSDATANRGSGGGGGANAGSNGGAGSAGIVILKYRPGTGFQTITANGDVAYSRAQKKVGSSSIYFDGSGDYLSLADPGWDWESSWTVDFWVRFSSLSSNTTLWSQNSNQGDPKIRVYYDPTASSGTLTLNHWGSTNESLQKTNLGLSTDTWYHFEFVQNGASSAYMFVDGTLEASGTWSDTSCNPSHVFEIGREDYESGNYLDGYIDEFRVSDTARHTSSFTPSTTEYSADANTLLLIHSDFNGGLGADNSGNTNDFTPTNLVATDQVLDSPTNNFATLNPLDENGITLSEGNLKAVGSTSPWSEVRNTIGVSSGKWYWEVLYVSTAELEGWVAGIRSSRGALFQAHWYSGSWSTATNGHCYGLLDSGTKVSDGSSTASFTSALSANDIIGFALDLDSGTTTLEVYVNGSSVGTMYSSLQTGEHYTPAFSLADPAGSTSVGVMNLGSDSSFAGAKTAQGNQDGNGIGDFYYTPPSGFKALCSDNLPNPSIADPTKHFNTVLYTGSDSSADRAITGVGFQPDLVWSKIRSTSFIHLLYDSVRGAGKALRSNATNAEDSDYSTGYLSSFDSDGFSTVAGSTENTRHNYTSQTYAVWNWKAGGTASSNTDGSITSSVSANTDAGFSIVSFTGNGTAGATVGHGLSQAPEFWVTKNRDSAYAWFTGTPEYPNPAGNYYIQLDASMAAASNTGIWNGALASSSVITLGNLASAQNNSGDAHIAYCFHSVDGYSKVGSFTGNNSVTDNTFVYTGFKPAFLLIKNIDTSGQNWTIWDNKRDTYNVADRILEPNDSRVEQEDVNTTIDLLSNGFKPKNNNNQCGGGPTTFLYYAVASSPFKTSNAR